LLNLPTRRNQAANEEGRDVMNRIVFTLSVLAVVGGCSTLSPRHESRHAGNAGLDLRGTTPLHFRRAKVLVSGPALVQHLETDGEGTVALYLADDPGIGDRACPSATAENVAPLAVLGRQSRVTDVTVPEGKRICAAAGDTRSMTVAWHARAAAQAPSGPVDVALRGR
jgi:hypothetical protein